MKENDADQTSVDHNKQKVDSLLQEMTIQEKVGQMVQYSGGWDLTGPASSKNNKFKKEQIKKGMVGSMLNVTSVEQVKKAQQLAIENSRLKIPMLFGFDVIHGYKTMFPVPLAEAASWDLELMEQTAQVATKEATASGINWTFAPMVDISQDARWGRIMESAGEDPFLNTQVALSKVRGYQGADLSNQSTMAACAKHYAGYGFVIGGREYNSVNLGNNQLHNVVLPPFKALAENGVATFMNSFSDMDGVPATASHQLQTKILKKEWGFDGFIVSDWDSIGELEVHGVAKDEADAAKIAVNAGNDMDMESNAYAEHLVNLVKDEDVSESRINDAVSRILMLKFKLGLFDDPYKYCDPKREQTDILTSDHLELAHEAALKSIVLLKNNNGLLPISNEDKSIALIGPLADDKNSPLGNWRARVESNSAVSLLEGLRNKLSSKSKLSYHKGVDFVKGGESFMTPLDINTTDDSKIKEAVALAKQKDLVIMVVGENAYQSGEGRSQSDISLPGLQKKLIKSVYIANPNIIMVLMNGRPMDISWSAEHIPAIIEAWHLGSKAGDAIADVLLGRYNPSGKLPVSFPADSGQEPFYYNHKNTGRPSANENEVIFSHYNDSSSEAVFPFGYGLSYTEYEYDNLRLNKDKFSTGDSIIAKIDVSNTGSRKGEEIVQLYLRDLVASVTRPVLELKGFKKIELSPGETRTVSFKISEDDIAFYTANQVWDAEPGKFNLFIGPHSEDLLSTTFIFEE
jgi:beta-glucosidase